MSESIRKIQMHSGKRSNNVAMYVINKVPDLAGYLVIFVSLQSLVLRFLR